MEKHRPIESEDAGETRLRRLEQLHGELDQVVMESNHTECVEIYEKMKALADEVGDNLRKAYNG